jgi:hypothetical protein
LTRGYRLVLVPTTYMARGRVHSQVDELLDRTLAISPEKTEA